MDDKYSIHLLILLMIFLITHLKSTAQYSTVSSCSPNRDQI